LVAYREGGSGGGIVKLSAFDPDTETMRFALRAPGAYTIGYNPVAFADIQGHWSRDTVAFLASRQIVNGRPGGQFAPADQITRCEFLKLVVDSIDGLDLPPAAGAAFPDVPPGAWYARQIVWAYEMGIVNGLPNGSFLPGRAVSRQDMAVIIHRLIQAMSWKLDIARAAQDFTDQDRVSGYAADAVSLLWQYGVVGGLPNGAFNPRGTASRAEAGAIVKNLMTALLNSSAVEKDEEAALTIRGDGVANETSFSRANLENMAASAGVYAYSVTNNFPTDRVEYAAGAPLADLLAQAGLKETAQLVTVIASDGYRRNFTVAELIEAPRYYFPASGEKSPVPTILAVESGGAPNSLAADDLRLVMGQRARGEQNNPWLVKSVIAIEVSCSQPDQWPEVTFEVIEGDAGAVVALGHANLNSVKIYYTTDGSDPTVESAMYNVSGSQYQPELNAPLTLSPGTEVRARAIGPGRRDSAVSSFVMGAPS
ncbi:MAG: S-layer homology domain-containing protein, partial [Oscillospiraceae bacterium]|nr:S-layer homology domain-containing protein [Oscillospiraceae bacterium]